MRIGLSGFACIVFSSNLAAADDGDLGPQKNTLSVGVTAGVFLPDGDVHDFYYTTNTWQPLNTTAPAFGLRLSYEPIRFAGIEAEGEMIPIRTATTDDGATILGGRAQIIGQLPARVTPFVLLGAGSMGLISGDSVLGDDTDFIWHLGAGAKLFINSRFSVRLDGRLLLAPKLDLVAADDAMVNHFLITTSLSWTLGASRSPVAPSRLDQDNDGVIGGRDKCPFDAGVAPDGCPAAKDRDRDGIADAIDRCPGEPETVNEVDDWDGCPDKPPDSDGDGLANGVDRCPDAAEDADGFQDDDGCPDTDNDDDGVPDGEDRCVAAKGPADNGGCPDKDGDGDGLADRFDNCPAEAGTAERRGCRTKQLVIIDQNEIKVLDKVYFATDRARVRSRSQPLLDNLAQVLNAHPEITHVYVEGHTDDEGDAARNTVLSRRRAQAVVDKLVGKGVSANRLEAVGRGEDNPIADNRRARGRSQNRRVEFRIERAPATPTARSAQ